MRVHAHVHAQASQQQHFNALSPGGRCTRGLTSSLPLTHLRCKDRRRDEGGGAAALFTRLGSVSEGAGGGARRGEGESPAKFSASAGNSARARASAGRPEDDAGLLNGLLKAPPLRLLVQAASVWSPCWESLCPISNQVFIKINECINNQTRVVRRWCNLSPFNLPEKGRPHTLCGSEGRLISRRLRVWGARSKSLICVLMGI